MKTSLIHLLAFQPSVPAVPGQRGQGPGAGPARGGFLGPALRSGQFDLLRGLTVATQPAIRRAGALSAGATPGDARFDSADLRASTGVAVERPLAGKWVMPAPAELQQALAAEPVIGRALTEEGSEETSRWIGQVHQALCKATEGDVLGGELVMRFPACYAEGALAHIAIGTVFRNPSGALEAHFLHQESLPDTLPGGGDAKTFTGRFYPSFDTAADHPNGIAPVAESVRLVGLPYVNVFACARPQELPQITKALQMGVRDHVYAPSPTWPGVVEGRAGDKPYYGTCFTTTSVAHDALAGKPLSFPEEHDFTQQFAALAPLASIDMARYQSIPIGKSEMPLGAAFSSSTPARRQKLAFLNLGGTWGEDRPWQAQPARSATSATISVAAGPLRVADSRVGGDWQAMRFERPQSGITIDGEAVRVGVTYTRAECDRMEVASSRDVKVSIASRSEA